MQEEETNLLDCVTERMRICQPTADKNGVALEHLPGCDQPLVMADRRLILQIILNLASNAMKFNPRGGRADIGLEADRGAGVRVMVRDTGIGIPPDNIERVNYRFKQSSSLSRRLIGLQIMGLAL